MFVPKNVKPAAKRKGCTSPSGFPRSPGANAWTAEKKSMNVMKLARVVAYPVNMSPMNQRFRVAVSVFVTSRY